MRKRVLLLAGVLLLATRCATAVQDLGGSDGAPATDASFDVTPDIRLDTTEAVDASDGGTPEADAPDLFSYCRTGPTAPTGAPTRCPSSPCDAGSVCCGVADLDAAPNISCHSTCPNASPPADCLDPSSCTGSAPYCCATLQLAPPNCLVPSSMYSSCSSTPCDLGLAAGCPATEQARLCHSNADCADLAGESCCNFEFQGNASASVWLCVPPKYQSFTQGCCPP